MSSSSTTGSSGVFVWRMNCHQDSRARCGCDSRTAVRSERHSSTTATPSTTNATAGRLELVRVA